MRHVSKLNQKLDDLRAIAFEASMAGHPAHSTQVRTAEEVQAKVERLRTKLREDRLSVAGRSQAARKLLEYVTEFPKSLGIPRSEMPQIEDSKSAAFVQYLEKNGVRVSKGHMHVGQLKPTQSDLNMTKVHGMMAKGPEVLAKPIIISSDNYVLDGHHRWAALYALDPENDIPVIKAQAPIRKLLDLAHGWEHVDYKHIGESKMDVRTFNFQLEAMKTTLREKSMGVADLTFPGDCRQKDLVRAAEKDGVVSHGGNHDTVYDHQGKVVTQIPRHDPKPGTCRAIIKSLKQTLAK